MMKLLLSLFFISALVSCGVKSDVIPPEKTWAIFENMQAPKTPKSKPNSTLEKEGELSEEESEKEEKNNNK